MPGWVKVNENDSPDWSSGDWNGSTGGGWSGTVVLTSCGMMASRLVQVTVSPALIWMLAGAYAKSLIDTTCSTAAAGGATARMGTLAASSTSRNAASLRVGSMHVLRR